MIRKSRRELERALDELSLDAVPGDRPEPLDAEEKAALADLFDVDPEADGQSRAQETLQRLQEGAY